MQTVVSTRSASHALHQDLRLDTGRREEEARAGKKAKLKDRMRSMITKASNRAKRFSMKMPSLRQGPAAT